MYKGEADWTLIGKVKENPRMHIPIIGNGDINSPQKAKEYFDRCFEEIRELELSRCIIIGDSLSSDIQGGINAGIRSCWYNPRFAENKKGIEPDYEIFDLKQIAVLLENLFG